MGGAVSEVSDSTTRVLMEAATWVGTNILSSSSRLGLRTEASARFEKQLHPDLAIAAQRLAARLMVELCGARLVPGTIDAYPAPVEPLAVPLRPERVGRLLGSLVRQEESVAVLERLGFEIAGVESGALQVAVPYWRSADVTREADLIEEVARIHGLDRLPETLPARRLAVGRLTAAQALRRRIEDAMRDRGLSEVVAYSFIAPATLERLRVRGEQPVALANPLSEDQSLMRPLLLPGLLDAARHNAARGRPDTRLFESAHVYAPGGGERIDGARPRGATPAVEHHHFGVLLAGGPPAGWRTPAAPGDFYAGKALLEAVLDAVRVDARVEPDARPFLHPGRSGAIVGPDGSRLGWIGEVHPEIAAEWDLEAVTAFELDADALAELAPGPAAYRDVTSFPAVVQDIAVVVAEETSAAEVEAAVTEGGGELLDIIRVFDVYHGEQVGEGKRSLALRLEFRAPDRTLTDEEVAAVRREIEARLEAIGGRLRA
jgi:phenylalanyl-tRNA synthetase beta chain